MDTQMIELDYLKLNWYEKGVENVEVHLYVRDTDHYEVQFEAQFIDVFFSTGNATFLKNQSAQSTNVFHYKIITREEIDCDGSSFVVKKAFIELNVKKKQPIPWPSLHKLPSKEKVATVKESSPTKENSPSKYNQLLGGKSTPVTKKTEEQDIGESVEAASASVARNAMPSSSNARNTKPAEISQGMTGLENYANNCYMNVVIQMLANIYEIREYFKNDAYLKDISSNNPLSSGGKVVKTFSEVIKALWTPPRNVFKPQALKNVMGKQCSLFVGWQQHDAQEFFSSLLDNLHEDLNQPSGGTTETPADVNERPETAWNTHIKRNVSLIVKLFHGQLMSKLTCSSCHKVSYSYDPCAQISLPIPSSKQYIRILYFPCDMEDVPLMIPLQISTPHATHWHLLNILQTYVPARSIAFFAGLTGVLSNINAPLMHRYKYVIANELPSKEDILAIPTFQYLQESGSLTRCDYCYRSQSELAGKLKRCTKCMVVCYCSRDCQLRHWPNHKLTCTKDLKMSVGLPFFFNLAHEELTYDALEAALCRRASFSVEEASKPFVIKTSANMNANDQHCRVVTKDNFEASNILKATCLIIEWQGVVSREEPVYEVVDTGVKEDEHYTLQDSLRLFMEPERLEEKDSWKCPKCKTQQSAKKEMGICSPPCMLLLHLKRFTFGDYGEKIIKTVHYPLTNFDLAPFICKETADHIHHPLLYNLCGVICHRGTIRMGHYTAIVRTINNLDQEEAGWRYFDDETVTRMKADKAVSPDAYVLVYRLQGTQDVMHVDRLLPVATVASEPSKRKDSVVKGNSYKRSLSLEFEDNKKEAEVRRCSSVLERNQKGRRSFKRGVASSEEVLPTEDESELVEAVKRFSMEDDTHEDELD